MGLVHMLVARGGLEFLIVMQINAYLCFCMETHIASGGFATFKKGWKSGNGF